MVKIVLVEPSIAGNIGAVARVMKNFNLTDLILINPQTDHLSQEAKNRAKHAQEILKKAKIYKTFKELKNLKLISTTAKLGNDYNLRRTPINLQNLNIHITKKTAIVFGSETYGLTNKQIEQCDLITIIPTNTKYSTLNLSHAVGIVCYELFKQPKSIFKEISKQDKISLQKLIKETITYLPFSTETKKQTQIKLWKNIINKTQITKRESQSLFGYFKKVKQLNQKSKKKTSL